MANIMNYLDWLPLLTNYWRGCFLFVETPFPNMSSSNNLCPVLMQLLVFS